jgi:hypothetical protein
MAMPGVISSPLAQLLSRITLESDVERILEGVAKSFRKKLTPIAAGRISLSCP